MTKAEITQITQEALSLPVEDQLDLARTLWEHASPPSEFELSPELKEILEVRRKDAEENLDDGLSWEEVKAQILDQRCSASSGPTPPPSSARPWTGMTRARLGLHGDWSRR